jgi:hypothetical protein
MALSQEERERVTEEEQLRFETRMKAHNAAAGKSGACGVCGACGHKPVCGGCRIWAVVLGFVVLFILFRSFACTHEDRCRFYGYGDRSMMGHWDQNQTNPPLALPPQQK